MSDRAWGVTLLIFGALRKTKGGSMNKHGATI